MSARRGCLARNYRAAVLWTAFVGLALGAVGATSSTVAAGGAGRATSPGGSWTTYGGNSARTSVQRLSPAMRPLRRRWLSADFGAGIYGQPLIDGGRVFVATEGDLVIALNARNGRVIWRRSVGNPVPAGMLPCGDIQPDVGVTSTMVLDPATGELYASAAVLINGSVRHKIFGLATATGHLQFSRDLDQSDWTAPAQLQRTGLALDNGRVLVGFGGNYGDCGSYHGYLISVPETGRGALDVYEVPTQREGAIWAPSGVAVTKSGTILLATGNGSSSSAFDHGDSVIELSPTLAELGYFAPSNWAADNRSDGDLGSTSPILVSGGRAFIVGKERIGYLLNAAHPGGIGGQLTSTTVCFAMGGDAYLGSTIYVGCPGSGVTAVRVGPASLSVLWQAGSGEGGPPTIVGGVLWTVANGTLTGLAPSNGSVIDQLETIDTEHFAAPSAGEGLLVVAGTGRVEAFEGPRGYRP